jgi:hypothetical protein
MVPMLPPAQMRSGASRGSRDPFAGSAEGACARTHELGASFAAVATASLRIDEGPHWLAVVRLMTTASDRCHLAPDLSARIWHPLTSPRRGVGHACPAILPLTLFQIAAPSLRPGLSGAFSI